MLSGLADNGFVREPPGVGPRPGDEIILLGPVNDANSWTGPYSYGTITGLGSTAALGIHYVVTPAQLPWYQGFPNCALQLISESLAIKPEFEVGDELPLFHLQAPAQGSWATLVIEEREVALKDDGQPFYSYCFSIKGHGVRSKGLEEEALKKFLQAANPVNGERAARKKELERYLPTPSRGNGSDATRGKELKRHLPAANPANVSGAARTQVLKKLLPAVNPEYDSPAAGTEDYDIVYVLRTKSDGPTSLGISSEAAENEVDLLAQSSWADTVVIL